MFFIEFFQLVFAPFPSEILFARLFLVRHFLILAHLWEIRTFLLFLRGILEHFFLK